MKIWTTFILLTLLVLAACAAPGSASPTPTIVRLDRSQPGTTATVAAANPTATVTPIAQPSLTLTATPVAAATDIPVTPAATPTAATAATGSPVRVEVITTALYLRAGPGLDYAIIGGARDGDQFNVIGISPANDWLQIVTAAAEPGWISANSNYTRLISATIDTLPVLEPAATPAATTPAANSAVRSTPTAPTAAAWSGSQSGGGVLVFAAGSGGDLYRINADGSGLQKLASGVIDPVVSPDGQQVAFTRWDSGELGTLYTINIDGSNEQAILGEILQAKSPTWSPDGQSIVVSFQQGGLRNPQEECRTFDADDRIRLPDDIAEITHTSFSDGEFKICFIRREDLQWLLREVDVATAAYEDLPVDLYSYAPAWDPQNAWRVIYEGEKGLMQLDLNSGSNTPLTTDLRDTAPVFSPDGQTLAMTYKQHDHWEVYTYDLVSGNRQRLTKPPLLADPQYNSAAPAWSPDGSQIAFVTDRNGQWEIWVMNADGSNQHPLFDPAVQAQLGLQYDGMHERLLNWVGSADMPGTASSSQPASTATAKTTAARAASLAGAWDFTFGTLALTQRDATVEGTYQWYGGADTGQVRGIVVAELDQFQGVWISDRSLNSQSLIRWQLAADRRSFTGTAEGGSTSQQWCGVRSGQPLPAGCGFSGVWQLRFGNPPGLTGQATLVQTGQTVQGTYVDSEGHTGEIDGVVTAQSITEAKLTGVWRNDEGEQDTFEWRLDLTTGRTFQGHRNPGNSEWCGWRAGTNEPEQCGWQD